MRENVSIYPGVHGAQDVVDIDEYSRTTKCCHMRLEVGCLRHLEYYLYFEGQYAWSQACRRGRLFSQQLSAPLRCP